MEIRQNEDSQKQDDKLDNQQQSEVKQITQDQYQKEFTNKDTKKQRKNNTHLLQQQPKKQQKDKEDNSNEDYSQDSQESQSSEDEKDTNNQKNQNLSKYQSQYNTKRKPARYHIDRSNPNSPYCSGGETPERENIRLKSQKIGQKLESTRQKKQQKIKDEGLQKIEQKPQHQQQLPHDIQHRRRLKSPILLDTISQNQILGPGMLSPWMSGFGDLYVGQAMPYQVHSHPFTQINYNIQPIQANLSNRSSQLSNLQEKIVYPSTGQVNEEISQKVIQKFFQQGIIQKKIEGQLKSLKQEKQKLDIKYQNIKNFQEQIRQYQEGTLLKDNDHSNQNKKITKDLYQCYISLISLDFKQYVFKSSMDIWLKFLSAAQYFELALKQVQKTLLGIQPIKPIRPLVIQQPYSDILHQQAKYFDGSQFFSIAQLDHGTQAQQTKRKFIWRFFSGKKNQPKNSQKQLKLSVKESFLNYQAFKYYVAGEDALFQKELYKQDFLILISKLIKFEEILKTLKDKIFAQIQIRKSKTAVIAYKGYQILKSELEKLNLELKIFSLSLSDDAQMWFHMTTIGYLVNLLIEQKSYENQIQIQARKKIFTQVNGIFEKFKASNKDESA